MIDRYLLNKRILLKMPIKLISNCDILIVLNSLVAEGCPQLALNLSKYWSTKGIRVEIICIDKYPLDLIEEFQEIDVKVNFYKNLKKGFIRYFYLIYFTFCICKILKPYAILCFPFGWHSFIGMGAKLSGVKNICTHVGNYPPIREKSIKKFKFLVHFGRLFTKKCICCSDYVLNATKKYFSLPNEDLCRVYNCCDFNKFSSKNLNFLRDKKNINLGMVARLERHKDQSTLIKALPEILKKGIKVNLSIIGDGSKRKDLEELSQILGVRKLVNFMGSRRDISQILSKLDIFVFSVREDEGFGIAMAEAMISGIPILASDVGACLEILGNGEYGYFFKRGDPKDLAAKVLEMTINLKNVNQKVVKAKKYAKRNFSIKTMADSYLDLLML